jgi:hypothetical protein
MKMIFIAITSPFAEAARIQFVGVFQTVSARTRAMTKATGIALVAGHRNPTIKTKMATMGRDAIRASTPIDIIFGVFSCRSKIFKIFQFDAIILLLLIIQLPE